MVTMEGSSAASTTKMEEPCRLILCGHNKVCRCLFLLEGVDDDEDESPGDDTMEDAKPHMHLPSCHRWGPH